MHTRPLVAERGVTDDTTSGRGASVVAFYEGNQKTSRRVPRGPYAIYRRNEMWMNFAKHMKIARKGEYRIAKRAVMRALKQKKRSRRLFKRDRRTLWIMRVNNNCKLHGIKYSWFICKCKEANVNLNRKILSQLGVYDRAIFTNVMDVAIPNWKGVKAKREYVPPPYTVEQVDDVMIPYIEATVPELYTDSCVRFNRKVMDYGIEYTIDMGRPEVWREILPKMPELSNYQLPDHWMGNANAEMEMMELEHVPIVPGRESKDYLKFLEKVKATQAEDELKKEKGEETWPMRDEPLSRDDWFNPEPQSWF